MLSCPRKYKYFQGWLVFFMKNKFIKIAQAFTGSIHLPIFFLSDIKVELEPQGAHLLFYEK